jgi:hypothetical protein
MHIDSADTTLTLESWEHSVYAGGRSRYKSMIMAVLKDDLSVATDLRHHVSDLLVVDSDPVHTV